MKPLKDFTKVELPEDLFFVRRPERSQGRIVIPGDIATLIGCKRGDVILLTARNPANGESVSFLQTITMADNKLTMPKAARDAIGIEPASRDTDGWTRYETPGVKFQYPGIEFHIRGLYKATGGHEPGDKVHEGAHEVTEPKTYHEE